MHNSSEQDVGTQPAIDPADVPELWRRHRRWVAAVLLAHMPADAELDDLLQEVAMKLVRNSSNLRDPDAVRPWLRTVAINAARTAARRRRLRLRLTPPAPESSAQSWPDNAHHADPARAAGAREEADRLLRLARELHPDYAEPLLMRCVRGMTYRQIADALELPVTTVETRLARARRMLRELVDQRSARPAAAAAE